MGGSTLTYTYDGFNRLRAASRDSAASVCETNGACPTYPAGNMTYVVDAEGRREAKTDPNGETAWYNYLPNGQPSAELSNKRGFNYYIYLGNQPIAVVHNPLVYDVNFLYYIHADQLGRPEIITDGSQNKVWQGLNFAFDRSMLIENVSGIDIGLPGQIYDQETGHWNNGFRDYDSSSGRYLQSDPIGLAGGINTYAYVGNNPLTHTDPYGLWEWPSLPQGFVNASAGFGDTLSFGLTGWARGRLGIGSVDPCSDAYAGGQAAGIVAGFIDGEGEAELAISIGRNENQISHAFRYIDDFGMDRGAVTDAIQSQLSAARNEIASGLNKFSTEVNGVSVDYHAYRLPDGSINVGRITPRRN